MSELIIWRAQFELGIEEIDFEHRGLIDLINDYYTRLVRGEDDASEFLDEVHVSISAHFALEEKAMTAARWRELEAHKADHERLLDELRDIMDDCETGAGLDTQDLAARLEAWFTDHFRSFDARLHQGMR